MLDKQMKDKTRDGLIEVCPDCNATDFRVENKEQKFLYGTAGNEAELSARVPVYVCSNCGFEFTGPEAEDARHEAVCRHLRVMTPKEIVALRKRFGMSRSQFAETSLIGTASLARWEAGILIQNPANDQLLYLMHFEENIARLKNRALLPSPPATTPSPHAHQEIAREGDDTHICRRPLRAKVRQIESVEAERMAACGWRLRQ